MICRDAADTSEAEYRHGTYSIGFGAARLYLPVCVCVYVYYICFCIT